MAEDRQNTPEKQLLKLIESSKGEDRKPRESGPLETRRLASWLSVGALRGVLSGRLSFFKRTARKRIGSSKWAFGFTAANKILLGMVVMSSVYFLSDTLVSAIGLTRSPNFAFQNDKAFVGSSEPVSKLKDEGYYLEKVTQRDIFKEFKPPKEKKEVASPETDQRIKNLSLVGISWSANPDALIEDKASQRTFFVKSGKMIGDVKVESIYKDKVVLSCDGQEFELK